MSHDVFISYARQEIDAAKAVRSVLESNGISCWMDVEGIHGGDDFGEIIPAAIKEAKAVVFLLSARSQRSQWTKKEITTAINLEKPILPIAIEKCEVIAPFDFYFSNVQRSIVYEDMSQSLNTLVYDVEELTEKNQGFVMPKGALEVLSQKDGRQRTSMQLAIAAAAIVVAVVLGITLFMAGRGSSSTADSMASDSAKSSAQSDEAMTGSGSSTNAAATVYASDCFTYASAGSVASYDKLESFKSASNASYESYMERGYDAIPVSKAFSILSFIRNEGDSAARVESVSFEVLDLVPNEEPIIMVDAAMHDQTLLVYVGNDGWGPSQAVTFDYFMSDMSQDLSGSHIALSDLATQIESETPESVASGEVRRVLKCELDPEMFKAHSEPNRLGDYLLWLYVTEPSSDTWLNCFPVRYNEERGFYIEDGAGGDGNYSVTLFAVLDVDARPSSIRFTSDEATPRVEDTYRIETVIAPTKSCYLRCKDVYSVNGELQVTPEYQVEVGVPVFRDMAFGRTQGIVQELSVDPDMDQQSIQEIVDAYRYDPSTILKQSV